MKKLTVILALVGLFMAATSSLATVVNSQWNGNGVRTFGNYADGSNLEVIDITPFSANFFKFNTTTIGIYLNFGANLFYSEPIKNTDFYDPLVAYGSKLGDFMLPGNLDHTPWMQNQFVIAIKDAFGGNDNYSNINMVPKVESVAPVPEAGTMVLLGAGMLGLAIYSRRRMNK